MEKFRSAIIFWCLAFIVLIHQILILTNIRIHLLDAYLDDLLALPIILFLILFVQRYRTGNTRYQLPGQHIFSVMVIMIVIMEGVLPLFSTRYTSDIIDAGMYVVGALGFLFIQKHSKSVDAKF